MTRIIDPPRDQFNKLPTPLEAGERKVIDLFDRKLPPKWEIYVQPHLNGLRPDIVLLHPDVGVAVFEVKDWDLGAMRYFAQQDGIGTCTLWARHKNGTQFSRERDNPINRILLYERELCDLYCPRLDGRAGLAAISAGLVFPCSPRREVERVFRPFIQAHDGMRDNPIYYPISGADDLARDDIDAIFPEGRRTSSRVMNPVLADDLRGWLKEPFFSQEQRRVPNLNAEQRVIADTRTTTGYRRIKGPAGSGKSVALAARASRLVARGKHTLVVSFNITLINYLRDLTVRFDASRSAIRRQVDFLHFHSWCKRVCWYTGNKARYDELWASSSLCDDLDPGPVLRDDLASLMTELYQEDAGEGMPRYDAILVDEGQDFRLSWWRALRHALEPGGEMVLVADKTQDVYGTASAWTERAMKGAGFSGPWRELRTCYRLPRALLPLVRDFAEQFLTDHEIDVPEEAQMEFATLSPVELRWLHVRSSSDAPRACDSELSRMMMRLREDTAIPDITFLADSKAAGRNLVEMQCGKVQLLHTFAEDHRESRGQKLAFFKGGAKIKATTPHSFKGWEARHLIVFVESVKGPRDRALLYTALTRLRRHDHGSCLTVVSCCDELREYGSSWPDYQEF